MRANFKICLVASAVGTLRFVSVLLRAVLLSAITLIGILKFLVVALELLKLLLGILLGLNKVLQSGLLLGKNDINGIDKDK
mgnify:CR=1 FL=1